MIYPRLPEELDDRRKLSNVQIDEIRKLYKAGGWTWRSLGIEYNVSKTIVGYYVSDPERRERINKKRAQLLEKQKIDDPDFAKKHKEQTVESYKNCLKKFKPKRVYKGLASYKWKKTKYHTDEEFRNKCKLQSRKSSREYSYKRWHTDPAYREYQNEKNKQNYIKRLL